MDIIRAMETIQEGTETLGAHSLDYYVLQKQKQLFEKMCKKRRNMYKSNVACNVFHSLFNSPLLRPNIFLNTVF